MNNFIVSDRESTSISTQLTKEQVLEALQFLRVPFGVRCSEDDEVCVSVSSTDEEIKSVVESYLSDYVLRAKILSKTSMDVEKLIDRIIEKSLGH